MSWNQTLSPLLLSPLLRDVVDIGMALNLRWDRGFVRLGPLGAPVRRRVDGGRMADPPFG
jgi:hypothetical protein